MTVKPQTIHEYRNRELDNRFIPPSLRHCSVECFPPVFSGDFPLISYSGFRKPSRRIFMRGDVLPEKYFKLRNNFC